MSALPSTPRCGCGALEQPSIPVSLENRPGLSALAYRVGTHGRFKEAMIQALAARPELAGLTTRYDADPTLALIDGWAAVLEVLTFYQERIANEGYLRTATERRSVLELARTIGYELGPGVAAGTYLAFTLDQPLSSTSQAIAASTPSEIHLPIGTRAQSIPGPDELPQTFETVEDQVLQPAWNRLRPRMGRLRNPAFGDTHLYLAGTSTNLKAGDALLIVGSERANDPTNENWDLRFLTAVEPDPARGVTRVSWSEGLGTKTSGHVTHPAALDVQVHAFRTRAAVFGHNAQEWPALPDSLKAAYLGIPEDDLDATHRVEWPGFKIYAPAYPPQAASAATRALVATAPGEGIASESATGTIRPPAGTIIDAQRQAQPRPLPVLTSDSIDLDTTYPAIVRDSWIALAKPDWIELYQVADVTQASRAQFLLTAKVTRLKLGRAGKLLGESLALFENAVRETTVLAQSEFLPRGEEPLTDEIAGNTVDLDTVIEGLESGRRIAITGHDSLSGSLVGEVAVLDRTELVDGVTRLVFADPLQHRYTLDDVVFLNANVVRATHGESRTEILGSGDGSQAFQTFTLKHRPLTHVAAATARGTQSTLEVRVQGVLWHEVPSLHAQASDARVYVTRRADDGSVTLQFGDGITGARLPTGQDNVTALYRVGIGTGALVKAGQISLLMSRPLGLKEVVNPAAPTGADDPETLEGARDNAPLTVLTLDRIVSLQDFEDFARAFAGIAKARATLLWNGEQRLAFLTVAGVDGAEVVPGSDLYRYLKAAIDGARHVDQEVRIGAHARLTFDLTARIKVLPDYLATDVLPAVAAALENAFSFEARAFGQGVASSEIIATAQAVEGVEAVVLADLRFTGASGPAQKRLPAADARWNATESDVLPAQLLTLRHDGITLTELVGV